MPRINEQQALMLSIVLMLACATTSWLWWSVPDRSKVSPRAENSKLAMHHLYAMNGTAVKISSGDIFTAIADEPQSAIVIGAKTDLSEPHVETSIDYKFRALLRAAPNADELLRELVEAARKAPQQEVTKFTAWIAPLSPSLASGGRKPYMLAGVDVDVWGGQRPKDALERKARIIEAGVEMALVHAGANGIKRVYLPMLGAGAGALGPRDSIQALLSGVNAAAYSRSAPSEVVLLFFAQSKHSPAQNDQLSQLAFAAHEVINDYSATGPWKPQSKYLLASQLFLLVAGVLASALLATWFLRSVILTPTTIIANVVKWVIVGSGVIALGQSAWYAPSPLETDRFVVLLIAACIIPFWEWGKLSEPKIKVLDASPNQGMEPTP
ncbi:hypothetical protein [Accumulibacter sp.]|uniref:hypothetical protein n=1 Tax=Accumulibacter sp. TaxID=2053492 RepID=UPI001AC04D07|nr:hypothetical protein [Accumulibacter sp.]MBN8454358.1 hypothetical protein [Accumulibacter sp.]MBO3713331.1 hypothetical protein [Accumulibacter sp.]